MRIKALMYHTRTQSFITPGRRLRVPGHDGQDSGLKADSIPE
jgi:hypothetical protein